MKKICYLRTVDGKRGLGFVPVEPKALSIFFWPPLTFSGHPSDEIPQH